MTGRRWGRWIPASAFVLGLATLPVSAHPQEPSEEPEGKRDWEIAGLPTLNFDSDEGFGYGAIVEAYLYDVEDRYLPYLLTIRPTVQLSSEGRRDFTVFVDSPHLIGDGWRLTVFGGTERHTATPYYGVGNDSEYDETLEAEDGPNPHYYRFGRTRDQLTFDLQRDLGDPRLRFLLGGGSSRITLDTSPHDDGTTFLANELQANGRPLPDGWTNYLRTGLVWDTRDRELGPRSGVWSEVLLKRAANSLGSDYVFTRWTVTDRRYVGVGPRLVFANRLLLQGTAGNPPFYELQLIENSFRVQEGLGGSKTLRGVLKNRLTGKGVFLWNAELRWRAVDFTTLGRDLHLVLIGFVDSGRVWAGGVDLGEAFSDLRHGFGGGFKIGMGENFIAGVDLGYSDESSTGIYIGLGYLY